LFTLSKVKAPSLFDELSFFGNITGQVESILEDLESIEENDEASIL